MDTPNQQELYHHGVKGMKWGVRRYQNKDGSLTPAGKKRVEKYTVKEAKKLAKRVSRLEKYAEPRVNKLGAKYDRTLDKYGQSSKSYKKAAKFIESATKLGYEYGLATAELKRLNNMTLKDISAEKSALGKAYLTSTGLNALSVGALFAGSPVAAGYKPNNNRIKSNVRVDINERKKIYDDALKRASALVYG